MPIYEFECRKCHHEFEQLILKGTVAACPACQSQELERLLSGFAVSTEEMSQANVQKARARNRASANYKDRQRAEAEHLHEHVSEHMNDHGHEGLGKLKG